MTSVGKTYVLYPLWKTHDESQPKTIEPISLK